jgi:hypothetical protein
MSSLPGEEGPISSARKWAITLSVMVVAFMQVLDTSVTNVVLPHLQGSLSAGLEEVSWVITSYLAANAVIIPASGWLTAVFGRRRFYLICTVTFTASSFLSGLAPNLEFLVAMRILQGLGGGPVIPMAQAIMWEIFPLKERGTAMAVWGFGIMLAPILGPKSAWRVATSRCPASASRTSTIASPTPPSAQCRRPLIRQLSENRNPDAASGTPVRIVSILPPESAHFASQAGIHSMLCIRESGTHER